MSFAKGMAEAVASKASSQALNATGKGDDTWITLQLKTFTNWVNAQLSEVGAKVDKVEDDFKSGVAVIQMIEVCSKKSLGKYNKIPKIPTHCLENLTLAIKFLEKEGLKLVNIGPQDIHAGNLKLILGFLWTIIYHFQVSKSFKEAASVGAKKGTAKDLLLEWVRATIPEYNITNFNKDWNDGRAICALANAVAGEPSLIPTHRQMAAGAGARNAKVGIDAAYENLGIPRLIAPEDLANPAIDDLSVTTYVSYFRDAKRVGAPVPLNPSEDNADSRAAMQCKHPGCSGRRRNAVTPFCPEHACHNDACTDKAAIGTHACPAHACRHASGAGREARTGDGAGCPEHSCKHPAGCNDPTSLTNSAYCNTHGCIHPSGCDQPCNEEKKSKFCATHMCKFPAGCRDGCVGTEDFCTTHTRGKRPSVAKLPSPWERPKDWRKYEGVDLGGRCKIRVFFSSTTSSQGIRRNTKNLMELLERENVHKRPDFEPWIPIDVDMPTEKRNLIFEKAKTKTTPMLFIDDEYIGDWKKVEELNEIGELTRLLEY